MTKTKRIVAALLTLIMIACIIPVSVFAADPEYNGWYNAGTKDNPEWYYYINGEKYKDGWKKIGSKWYFFWPDGMMAANTIVKAEEKDTPYAVDKNGAMVTKKGWFRMDYSYEGKTYYDWCYVLKGGAVKTGWHKDGGKWYYLDPDYGYMYYNSICKDGNKLYVFNKSGVMVTKKGWFKSTSFWDEDYSFWVYVNKGGTLKTGWHREGKNWYYLHPEYGIMACSTSVEVDGIYYYFDDDGVCINPDGSAPAT